jgi:hypothetical protein
MVHVEQVVERGHERRRVLRAHKAAPAALPIGEKASWLEEQQPMCFLLLLIYYVSSKRKKTADSTDS